MRYLIIGLIVMIGLGVFFFIYRPDLSDGEKADRAYTKAFPVHAYAMKNDVDNLMKAIQKEKDLDLEDSSGFSALQLAAYCGSLESAEILVQSGATVNRKGARNAIFMQTVAENPIFMHILTSWSDGSNVSQAKCKLIDMVNFLIKARADINAHSINGLTALHLAVDRTIVTPSDENYEIVSILLKNNADPLSKSDKGETPLSIAVHKKNQKLVDMMSLAQQPK